jgi:hypothetical protein
VGGGWAEVHVPASLAVASVSDKSAVGSRRGSSFASPPSSSHAWQLKRTAAAVGGTTSRWLRCQRCSLRDPTCWTDTPHAGCTWSKMVRYTTYMHSQRNTHDDP